MPYANPADRRAFEKARSEKRRAAGLCKTCANEAQPGRTRCQDCADKRRKV